MPKKMPKKAKKSAKNWGWQRVLRAVLVGVQAVSSVALIISLIKMQIIGGLEIFLFSLAALALLALTFIKLVLNKTPSITTRIICSLISLVCIVGSIVALRYTGSFNNFLEKITDSKETKEYSVLVLEQSEYQAIEDIRQKDVGFLASDPNVDKAKQYLQDLIEINPESYGDVKTLLSTLEDNRFAAITLESDWVQAVIDELGEPNQKTRVIYTFRIELDETLEKSNKNITEEPFILYISGSDSRNGIKATARSDVNIVAVVNPKQGKILLASIPRDTYVQLHNTTGLKDKLSHTGIYGIDMSKNTIEDFLDIKIDHTLKVSFDTVVKVVDQLDGIEIDSDKAMRLGVENKNKKCQYVVGKQQVDGDCALRFARERKSYNTGDKHRGQNQQQVITSIINKLSGSKDYVLKIPAILDIAADSFETSLEKAEITDFIRLQLNNQTNWQVESIAIDGEGAMQPTYSMGADLPLYVMFAYPDSLQSVKDKINQYLETE